MALVLQNGYRKGIILSEKYALDRLRKGWRFPNYQSKRTEAGMFRTHQVGKHQSVDNSKRAYTLIWTMVNATMFNS